MKQSDFSAEMSCFGLQNVVLSERELMLIRTTAYYTAVMMTGRDPDINREERLQLLKTHLENSTLQEDINSPVCAPSTLSVKEVANALGLSKPKAYELVRQEGFPAIRLGKNIRIPQKEFTEWLHRNSMLPRKE